MTPRRIERRSDEGVSGPVAGAFATGPVPTGAHVASCLRRHPFGSFETRCALDLYDRPHYAYGVQQGALSSLGSLGHPSGSASSSSASPAADGLGSQLQRIARSWPPSSDRRRHPGHLRVRRQRTASRRRPTTATSPTPGGPGTSRMDVAALQARAARRARLVLGDDRRRPCQEFLADAHIIRPRSPSSPSIVDYYSVHSGRLSGSSTVGDEHVLPARVLLLRRRRGAPGP